VGATNYAMGSGFEVGERVIALRPPDSRAYAYRGRESGVSSGNFVLLSERSSMRSKHSIVSPADRSGTTHG
jgi:hypothetical protein